jgi:very-short-patch-repair endonuclease
MKGASPRYWRVSCDMRNQPAKCDLVIARIAARQHGVVSLAQLRGAGMSKVAASRRTETGRLHRIHRGVYAVGHTRLTFEGRCMAAALALGDGAAISHTSAAALWGLLPPREGRIHLTISGDSGRERRPGISVHRSLSLIAGVTTRRNGIAVTKPARTLRDLHRIAPQPLYRRAVRRALDLRLITDDELRPDADLTRSELERIFLTLCRRHHLPRPETNARVGPYEVDFLWRDRGLIVETDGFNHHGSRAAFESDRSRDAFLQSRGYRVLRLTHRQVLERASVVAALRPLLAQSALAPNL